MGGERLLDLLSWLASAGGMVIYRDGEVHVYRGAIHASAEVGDRPLEALEEILSQVRVRWTDSGTKPNA